jgi:hypothetical protein
MNASDYAALNLLPQHAQLLAASATSLDVAQARGYRSATKKVELKELGFSDLQCRVPALVVPVFDVTGKVALHQIRPDEPRAGKDGKFIKYETLTGARMALDVHPSLHQHLGNPHVPSLSLKAYAKPTALSHTVSVALRS